jgi:FkbM family methyltransferase
MLTKLRYLYRAYRYRYRVDPAELRFICDFLQPGQVAVDAGCHKGAYTYWMRRQVGSAGAVYAFEPQPRQVAYLREVFSAMEYDNVVLVPAALSDTPGQMSLYIPTGAGQTHFASLEQGAWSQEQGDNSNPSLLAPCSRLTVEVTTLDTVFIDQPRGPSFMKIDVEGHELAVLHGARQTLAKYRPTLLIECEARHRPDGEVRPVFEFLESLGYSGSFFCRGYRQPLAAFDPPLHQPSISDTGQPSRGYVNNFVFECESD